MTFVFMKPRHRRKKIRKSEESQRVLDALNDYLEGNIDEPVKWLVRFWTDQAAAFTYKELRCLVTDEDETNKLFNTWFQDYSRLLQDRIVPAWKEAFLAGSESNPVITNAGFKVNTSDSFVNDWILNHSAEFVTNTTRDQVDAIRYILAESKAKNMSTAETARYIRPTVGLTERQAEANLKHYNSVKEQMKKDHPRMSAESIERKARESAAKYAGQQHRYRAETISRTEIAQAFNRGNDEAIRQAMNQGLIPIMKKYWSTADDGHVCTACEDLEGTEVDMDSDFKVVVGKTVKRTLSVSIPPLHPRCKCALAYEETGEYMTASEAIETADTELPDENYPYEVTEEYNESATAEGDVIYEPGYGIESHTEEIKTAEIIQSTFGGTVTLLKESDIDGVKRPDYMWNGKLWELKSTTTEKAANSAIKKGLQQIKGNPGGIILNYNNHEFSMEALEQIIHKRMQWWASENTVDIMVVSKGTVKKVMRYKGKK